MAYVITQPCCNDACCVDVCPVNCIHPTPDEAPVRHHRDAVHRPGHLHRLRCLRRRVPGRRDLLRTTSSPSSTRRTSRSTPRTSSKHPLGPDWPEPLTHGRDRRPRLGHAARRDRRRRARRPATPAMELTAHAATSRSTCSTGCRPRGGWSAPAWRPIIRAPRASPTHVRVGRRRRRRCTCHLNVEVGKHISHEELLDHHHAVIYAVGASSDRTLDIPGEDLPGSHAATEFVAWYNGHPDYADRKFDLSGERAVIVGNGNVALDVARILVTDPDELAKTDIADHALDALRRSNIREVVILGRRGPAQAAYTNPEFLALGPDRGRRRDHRPGRCRTRPAQPRVCRRATPQSRRVRLKVRAGPGIRRRTADPATQADRLPLPRLARSRSSAPTRRSGAHREERTGREDRPVNCPPRPPRTPRPSTPAWCCARSATAASPSPASRSTSARRDPQRERPGDRSGTGDARARRLRCGLDQAWPDAA